LSTPCGDRASGRSGSDGHQRAEQQGGRLAWLEQMELGPECCRGDRHTELSRGQDAEIDRLPA
jgi:hypothetical protein